MVIMTKSPPWPCRVCFWTCQNCGQAKSILIKLVLQKSPQRWCRPQGGDDGTAGSKADSLFGAVEWSVSWTVTQSSGVTGLVLWVPSQHWAGGEGWMRGAYQKHRGTYDTLMRLRCLQYIWENMMYVHAQNDFRTHIFSFIDITEYLLCARC